MLLRSRSFQFHKGTIKTQKSSCRQSLHSAFQFHKGTIKTEVLRPLLSASCYFNSIKVRLKPKVDSDSFALSPLFQFHKGTIKTNHKDGTDGTGTEFQFHKGTIKTQDYDAIQTQFTEFQFHKGTIKTPPEPCCTPPLQNFNSIKVRLKQHNLQLWAAYPKISIP